MDKNNPTEVELPTYDLNSLGFEGLTFVRGTWHAYYTVNRCRRRKSLSTTNKAEAVLSRNWFYRTLLSKIDVPLTYNRTGDDMIVEQKKYAVVVDGKVLYQTNSKKDARAFRNRTVRQ